MSDSDSDKESKDKPKPQENENLPEEKIDARGGARPKTGKSRAADVCKSAKNKLQKFFIGDRTRSESKSSGASHSLATVPQQGHSIKPDSKEGKTESKSPHGVSSSTTKTPHQERSRYCESFDIKKYGPESKLAHGVKSSSRVSRPGTSRRSRSCSVNVIRKKYKEKVRKLPDDKKAFLNDEIDARAEEVGIGSPQKSPKKEITDAMRKNDEELFKINLLIAQGEYKWRLRQIQSDIKDPDTASEDVSPMEVDAPKDLGNFSPETSEEASGKTDALKNFSEASAPESSGEGSAPENAGEVSAPENAGEVSAPENAGEGSAPENAHEC